jgi:L-amino acid N-acyltransferase YncA
MDLRAATENDLPVINEICNHYVATSPAIYQLEPFTADERAAWFAEHDARHPILVAVEAEVVIGWASLSRYHARGGYRFTVEDSVYVRHDRHGRGVGRALLDALLARAAEHGHHSVLAIIDAAQDASVALHARAGFEPVAHLREVGFKFGSWRDVVFMQRMI